MMDRRAYETEESLSDEAKLLAKLPPLLLVDSVRKIEKKFYPVDALAFKGGKATAIIEAKTRDHNFGTFRTYMFSLTKFSEGAALADSGNLEYIIAVMWLDRIGVWCLSDNRMSPRSVQIGGTQKRRDPYDIEPVLHIPLQQFKTFPL